MFPDMFADFEKKLKNIKASVQELEDFLPIMKQEYAKKHGISERNGVKNINEIPSQSTEIALPATDPPPRNDSEVSTPLIAPPSSAEKQVSGQLVVKMEPEDVNAEQPVQSEQKPEIVQVPGQKRRANDYADAQNVPKPKRALILIGEKPDRSNEFTIFNYKIMQPIGGRKAEAVTPDLVAQILPFIGAKGLFLPSDIEILKPFSPCYVKDVGANCIKFKVREPMAEQLRNWVNGPTYVEDSHLENAKYFSSPSFNAYLLSTYDNRKVSLFAFFFLVAQEIREIMQIDVKLAPEHLELSDGNQNRRVLTLENLLSDEWITFARNAFPKLHTFGKVMLDLKVRKMGYPKGFLKAPVV